MTYWLRDASSYCGYDRYVGVVGEGVDLAYERVRGDLDTWVLDWFVGGTGVY